MGPLSVGHAKIAPPTARLGESGAARLMDLRDVTLVNQDAVKVLAGAVPINARLSAAEIDRVPLDPKARGLVRHSSLSKPAVQLPWQLVLDEEPLDVRNDSCPDPVYGPEAILALIYTSGTTSRPKGVMVTHARAN